jgi:hypothetical protein
MCWFARPVRGGRNPVRHNIRRSVGNPYKNRVYPNIGTSNSL